MIPRLTAFVTALALVFAAIPMVGGHASVHDGYHGHHHAADISEKTAEQTGDEAGHSEKAPICCIAVLGFCSGLGIIETLPAAKVGFHKILQSGPGSDLFLAGIDSGLDPPPPRS